MCFDCQLYTIDIKFVKHNGDVTLKKTDQKTYISKKDEDTARITIQKERGKKDSKKKNSKENKIQILYCLLTNAKYAEGGDLVAYLV